MGFTDMEQAQRQAFEKIFPASQLCACYFHFSQAMIRKQKVTSVEISSKQLFSQALLDSTEEITKGEDYDVLEPWLGRGLLMRLNGSMNTRSYLPASGCMRS